MCYNVIVNKITHPERKVSEMKKTIVLFAAVCTCAGLFACGGADSSSRTDSVIESSAAAESSAADESSAVTESSAANESSAVLSLPSIEKAEIVAEYTEGADGYMYRLDTEGDLKYWIADVTMTDCGEKVTLTASSKDGGSDSKYLTAGSTISEISAVVTPYDADGNAGQPVTVQWDPARTEKSASEAASGTEAESGTETEYSGNDYVGVWGCGRATLVVDKVANNTYQVTIKWSTSAAESTNWTYDICNYRQFLDELACDEGGICTKVTCTEDGQVTEETLYEGSSAIFCLDAERKILTWADDKETREEDLEFVSCQ